MLDFPKGREEVLLSRCRAGRDLNHLIVAVLEFDMVALTFNKPFLLVATSRVFASNLTGLVTLVIQKK